MDKDYGSYKIKFPGDRPNGGTLTSFVVYGGDLDDGETKSFASYGDATTWADKRDTAKHKTARRKLNLPVLSGKGVRSTITGIHAAHGKILTSPDVSEKYASSDGLLPAGVQWIEDAQSELKTLEIRCGQIETVLRMFYIRPTNEYDSYSDHKHELWVSGIEKNHAALTKKAIERGGLKLDTLEPAKKLRA